jgi:hypothetical protein
MKKADIEKLLKEPKYKTKMERLLDEFYLEHTVTVRTGDILARRTREKSRTYYIACWICYNKRYYPTFLSYPSMRVRVPLGNTKKGTVSGKGWDKIYNKWDKDMVKYAFRYLDELVEKVEKMGKLILDKRDKD